MKETKIDLAKIEKISTLSAISFTQPEKDVMVEQVSGILDMLDACANVKKDKLNTQSLSLEDLREDVAIDGIRRDYVLEFAPRVEKGYFVVPKVVD